PNSPERDIRNRDLLLALLYGLMQVAFLGDLFPEMLAWIIEHVQENRWYRAAAWAAWLFCGLGGVLLIAMGVAWGISGFPLGQASDVLGGLRLTGIVLCLMAFFVIGGLLVIGYLAQGNKETREFASAWGRTKGKAAAGTTEDSYPV